MTNQTKQVSKDLVGCKVTISAEVVEHLRYGKQEWITILLPNNQKVILRLDSCQLASKQEE